MLIERVAQFAGRDRTESARQEEFARLWEQYRPRVWRLVARLAGDADLADDMTQEVSVRAFQAFGTFRGQASLYTWLYRIAVNVVLRHREHAQLEVVPLETHEVTGLPTDEAAGPEGAALREQRRRAVWAALDRLPEEQRTTVVLQIYEDLRYREIAEILSIPVGTVKSRLHNAMQRLREELDPDAL